MFRCLVYEVSLWDEQQDKVYYIYSIFIVFHQTRSRKFEFFVQTASQTAQVARPELSFNFGNFNYLLFEAPVKLFRKAHYSNATTF